MMISSSIRPGRGPGDRAAPSARPPTAGGEPGEALSYRELAVLELFAERLTNKEIAARLSVTPDAIKKRAQAVYRKLGVSDRYEAVAVALARGILTDRP